MIIFRSHLIVCPPFIGSNLLSNSTFYSLGTKSVFWGSQVQKRGKGELAFFLLLVNKGLNFLNNQINSNWEPILRSNKIETAATEINVVQTWREVNWSKVSMILDDSNNNLKWTCKLLNSDYKKNFTISTYKIRGMALVYIKLMW